MDNSDADHRDHTVPLGEESSETGLMEHTFPPVAPENISETGHETRREVSRPGEVSPRETEGEAGSMVVEPTNGMDVCIDRSVRLRGIRYFPTGSSSGRIVG